MYRIRDDELSFDKGYRLTIRSYEMIRFPGTSDGCGPPPTKRFPQEELKYILSWFEEVNGEWILNYSNVQYHFKMYRIVRESGEVDFYLISHARFGRSIVEGGFLVELLVKANDTTAAAIEKVYRQNLGRTD